MIEKPLPLKKAIIYRYSTPNAKGEDITNTISNSFTLSREDKLFLQFDLTGQKNLKVFYQWFCMYTSSANTSNVHFGTVKSLNADFTVNHTYTTASRISMNDVITQDTFFIPSKNLRTYTRSVTEYGIMITDVNGIFDFILLDANYDDYTITPTVTPSSLNLDDNPTFDLKFSMPKADNYSIKAYQNDILIGSKTGTKVFDNADEITIQFTSTDLAYNSLNNIRFDIEGTYKTESDTVKWSEYATYFKSMVSLGSVTVTNLTCNLPLITSFEPSGVNQDKDTNINVTWISNNQDEFTLTANNKTYSGIIAKGIVIPSSTFSKLETVNMVLTIRRRVYNQVFTATKTASFLLVGKPSTPVLEQKQYYSDAQPIFNWTCTDDYVQYRCEVYKSTALVFDSGDTVSSATSCQCSTTLENNTQYTVKVKVKTQFGYWSDYAVNTFTTQFVVANKPTINIYTSGNSIVINSDTVYSEAFDNCEIYRKTANTDWIRIAFNLDNNITYVDNFVGSETYYYKVTSVSTNNAKNDSDIASASISINNFNFANVEDIENGIELIGNPSISITQNRQVSTTLYSGCYAPVIENGIQNYKSGSASFTVRKNTYDKLLSIINNSKVLIYRDRRGEKFYCSVTSNLPKKYGGGDVYNINFNFVEVPFEEKDMYSGEGNLPIVFFDGKYQFDGTLTFNAELPYGG